MSDEFDVDFNDESDTELEKILGNNNKNKQSQRAEDIDQLKDETNLNNMKVNNTTNANVSEDQTYFFVMLFNNISYPFIKDCLLDKNLIMDTTKIDYDKESYDKFIEEEINNIYFLFFNTDKLILRALMKKYKCKEKDNILNIRLDTRCK